MKENVINILMYILQNASIEENTSLHDQDSIKAMLVDAGFATNEINEAFSWLDDLGTQIEHQAPIEPDMRSFRHFSDVEKGLLDLEGQNYLISLVNSGVLSGNSFELVMDRLVALGTNDIDLDQLEWIVLIVLSNQTDELAALERLETMRFYEPSSYLN